MSIFPDAFRFELNLTAGWTDVTGDVLVGTPQSVKRGIRASGPLDRVAGTGTLTFALRNDAGNSAGLEGYYSPGHSNCVSGFGPGMYGRLIITYEGGEYCKFYGRVPYGGIKVETGKLGMKRVFVEVRDYMEQAAIHELYLPSFTTEKRIDQIAALIVANMPTAPLMTDYQTGTYIFNTVFDTVRAKTKALTEFGKLALSELGYVYVRCERGNGEILTVEGQSTRPGKTSLSAGNIITTGGFLLQENGDDLLQENGDQVILDAILSITGEFDNSQIAAETASGDQVYNVVKLLTYPRRFDSSVAVLWTLQRAMKVEAGETVKITGRYRDPDGDAQVSGIDMVTPVATTDYLFNSEDDGSGTNMTASLTVTATYGTNAVEYELTNGAGTDGYVTLLQARGKGVYLYDTVESAAQDDDSIEDYGQRVLSIDMKYQDDPFEIAGVADDILAAYKTPLTAVNTILLCANKSASLMRMFLAFDIGDRIRLTEDVSGLEDEDYFINGVGFDIIKKVIYFTWYLKPAALDFA